MITEPGNSEKWDRFWELQPPPQSESVRKEMTARHRKQLDWITLSSVGWLQDVLYPSVTVTQSIVPEAVSAPKQWPVLILFGACLISCHFPPLNRTSLAFCSLLIACCYINSRHSFYLHFDNFMLVVYLYHFTVFPPWNSTALCPSNSWPPSL